MAVTATDADSGDTLTYSLDGTDAGSFTIDETVGPDPDRDGGDLRYLRGAEECPSSVTVKADDGAGGTRHAIAVTINVTDDDTEAPIRAGCDQSVIDGLW